MRVLLVCDRSAGHIFPALSIANYLPKKEVYLFIPSLFFKKYIKKKGFKVLGKSLPFRNLILEGFYRFWEAVYLLLKVRPQRIIGFGGRDTFFLLLLGAFFFLDTSLYEPNICLGKTNKVLSLVVKQVYCGFDSLNVHFKKPKWVGIPLREGLRKIKKEEARRELGFSLRKPVVLVLGGSRGSSFLNDIVRRLFSILKVDIQIIHLTGEEDYSYILKFYSKIKKKCFVKSFYERMDVLYSASDFLISRAGALSLAEIVYYHLPVILIPHCKAGNHQINNAIYFEKRGAACVIFQSDSAVIQLKRAVEVFLRDRELRKKIRNNLKKINLGVSSYDFYRNIFG